MPRAFRSIFAARVIAPPKFAVNWSDMSWPLSHSCSTDHPQQSHEYPTDRYHTSLLLILCQPKARRMQLGVRRHTAMHTVECQSITEQRKEWCGVP